jgi:hypothetical protein
MDRTLRRHYFCSASRLDRGIASRPASVAAGQQRRGHRCRGIAVSLGSAKAAPGLFDSARAHNGSDHAGGAGGFSPAPQLRVLERRGGLSTAAGIQATRLGTAWFLKAFWAVTVGGMVVSYNGMINLAQHSDQRHKNSAPLCRFHAPRRQLPDHRHLFGHRRRPAFCCMNRCLRNCARKLTRSSIKAESP